MTYYWSLPTPMRRLTVTVNLGVVCIRMRQGRSQKCEYRGVGRQMMKVEGQQVERENRGAVGAEDQKGEVWGRGTAPFPEIFF